MSIVQEPATAREGDLIAEARRAKGWSQRQLAEASRLSSVWRLSRLERNIQRARPEEAQRIIGALTSESALPRVPRRVVRSIFAPLAARTHSDDAEP